MNRFLRIAPMFAIGLLLLAGCAGKPPASEQAKSVSANEPAEAPYLSLFDGLHVTGTPVDVDIAVFRLKVQGEVERPLELSFQQIRELPAVRKEIVLDCPGFFTDRGVWTGVPVRDILAMAGVKAGAGRVTFTSVDGGYSQTLALRDLQGDGALIAYEFDGRPFHKVHGFPLRLAVEGKAGNTWVKWLGSLQVQP